MIPYFEVTTIPFWPWPIQSWGLLVAVGILTAAYCGVRVARHEGLNASRFMDGVTWLVLAGIVGARIGYLVFYSAGSFMGRLTSVFSIWDGGMSIMGGLLASGGLAYWHYRKTDGRDWLYLEIAALVYPLGEGIGRIGCFLIHDHLGISSNLFLAVDFLGGPRLDHGLLLSLSFLLLFVAFALLYKKRGLSSGFFFLPLLMIAWGVIRFGLDFFRSWDLIFNDSRFLMLTAAQWAGLVAVVIGSAWLAINAKKHGRV